MAAGPRPNLRIVRAEDQPGPAPRDNSVTPGTSARLSPYEAERHLTDEVVAAARHGEVGAWETIVLTCGDSLRGFLMVRLDYHIHDVDDAVAETYLRAIDKIDGFRSPDARAFRSWLFTIASRVAVDRYRGRAKLRSVAEIDEAPDNSLGDMADGLIFTEQSADLERAMAQLGPDDRQVLVLRFVADLTSEEVGQVMGKAPGAIRMQQMRALAVLRALMDR